MGIKIVKTEVEKASFQQNGLSMIWRATFLLDGELFQCDWVGKDEYRWWSKMAPGDSIKSFTGSRGTRRSFEINYASRKVYLVEIRREE